MKCLSSFKSVGLLLLAAVVCLTSASSVFAETNNSPAWIGSADTATIDVDSQLGVVKACRQKQISVVVVDREELEPYSGETEACVYEGENIEVTNFYRIPNGQAGVAVKRKGQMMFKHLLRSTINYATASETLTIQAGNGTRLTVVEKLSENIADSSDEFGNYTKYALKQGSERSLLNRPGGLGGYYESIYHTLSSNGHYAVAYVAYTGIVRINLKTGEEKSIIKDIGGWVKGPQNTYPAAVSDDGRFILLGPHLRVVDAYGCGWTFDGAFNHDNGWCQIESYNQKLYSRLGYTYRITMARFINDDYGVEVETELIRGGVVTHGDGLPKHITIKLKDQPTGPRIDYLALGDSYSSGEGDIENDGNGNKYYTPDTITGCHLSTRSYPFLLRDAWGIDSNRMASVACSGALVTRDFTSPLDKYYGQRNELRQAKDSQTRQGLINAAFDYFVPGRIPQIEFVKRYKPKVVTVTGSGNDVGFADILRYCAGDVAESWLNYTCEYAKDGVLSEVLNDSIDSQYSTIKNLIGKIKEASPGVKVYYIGYPSFIAGKSSSCLLNNGSLDDDEREMINLAISRLNGVIRQAAAATNVEYVDTESALKGGRLCEGSSYMTGLWDIGLVNISNQDTLQQAFHPNATGHSKLADRITKQITSLEQSYTPEPPNVVAIEPGVPTYRASIVQDDSFPEGEALMIKLLPGTTLGSSDYVVTTFSQPTKLGQYRSSEDGSIDLTVNLPESISAGMHVVLLEIINPEGATERLFQYIHLEKRERVTNDIDKDSQEGAEASLSIRRATSVPRNNTSTGGVGINSDAVEPQKYLGANSYQGIVPLDRKHEILSNKPLLVLITGILIVAIVGGIYVKRYSK
ncbi:MAG: SGNH/GDSL hydrolase family protein [Candidatus Saccharimonas sp.]